MGYIATDIATVPSLNGKGEEFNWYVFFLPGPLDNPIRDEILRNFFRLSKLVGTRSLMVTGEDIDGFHFDVIHRYALYLKGYDQNNIPLPSLLVTDTVPANVIVKDGSINAKVMLFPLGETYLKDGMLSNFLRQLCVTLQDTEAFDNIEHLNEKSVLEKWGWITRYFEYKINIFGFEPNFSAIIEDIMKSLKG